MRAHSAFPLMENTFSIPSATLILEMADATFIGQRGSGTAGQDPATSMHQSAQNSGNHSLLSHPMEKLSILQPTVPMALEKWISGKPQ